ncbi:MAG: glycosyltransferase family 4 protein [Candidatus Aenigmarchaeota archaeon]|nr:glycosyltransferase family 4 protein [Candidatus Aenigmarchaeota archaeon]
MKIAVFCWEFFPKLVGGLGTYAIEITKKFEELGHDVTVFTLNDGSLPTRENWNGIEIHRPIVVDASDIFPFFVVEDLRKWGQNIRLFSDIFAYNLLSATKFVNDCIKKQGKKFDIVAVHDWLSSISGLLIKKDLKDLPIAFHIHSVEEQRSLGGGSEVVKHLEKTMGDKANHVITVSNSMKEYLASLGYPANKITVCYNGCDPEKYDPANVDKRKLEELRKKYEIKPDEKVILFVGRLTWVKGVYNLVHAMPSILKDFPDTKLIILGKGEQYGDLIAHIQKHDIADKVNIRSEWVDESERITHYALADLCVFPSISEPFGIVSLEAMAMEKAVVVGAAGVSGLREQVIPSGENKTGVHVNGENPEDIAWGVKEILKNFEEAKKWGKNGRKRVLKEFTWDIAAEKTLSIYESLTR